MGRFCLFSFIFQLPFYTLVFSEWGCFFNSLRFINPSVLADTSPIFCCAKHPAMLRGTAGGEGDTRFVVAAVFLTPSVFSTPPSFGHLPYILLRKTPRNAAGHGKGRGLNA